VFGVTLSGPVEVAGLVALVGVQPRYGQKPPSVDRGVSFYCSDEVSALVVRAAVEAEHRETPVPLQNLAYAS
jgi:hypothetical protein